MREEMFASLEPRSTVVVDVVLVAVGGGGVAVAVDCENQLAGSQTVCVFSGVSAMYHS